MSRNSSFTYTTSKRAKTGTALFLYFLSAKILAAMKNQPFSLMKMAGVSLTL
jgi:hypothetical protein